MRDLSKLMLLILMLVSTFCYADNYPRNYSVDILHYKFELTLSDKSDEIVGQTTIDVLFNTDTSRHLRFDLVNRSAQLQGKGMQIEAVLFENKPISFLHDNNSLVIKLSKPFAKNKIASFVVKYRGIPADGLRIGNTNLGRGVFSMKTGPIEPDTGCQQ
jgi:hypothetical protein